MDKFAFIAHPLGMKHLRDISPTLSHFLQLFPQNLGKYFLQYTPPYKHLYMNNILSADGLSICGYSVICPLIPEQMVTLKQNLVIEKICQCVKLAKKLGAKIVGLGGFTSIIGNEGEEVAKRVDLAITSGNTYTAALVLEGIFKASKLLGINLSNSTVAIIGATGDIGSICAKILSNKVSCLILVARNEKNLKYFASTLKTKSPIEIKIAKYTNEAVKLADIILTATSALTTIIKPQDLNPGAILCDVALPANIAKEIINARNDVLVFEGGKAQLPYPELIKNRLWQRLFSDGIIFGCLAETMLLTFEKKFENYSMGRGNITEEKINEISSIAQKHGFSLADFKCGNKFFTKRDIEIIRGHYEKHRK